MNLNKISIFIRYSSGTSLEGCLTYSLIVVRYTQIDFDSLAQSVKLIRWNLIVVNEKFCNEVKKKPGQLEDERHLSHWQFK